MRRIRTTAQYGVTLYVRRCTRQTSRTQGIYGHWKGDNGFLSIDAGKMLARITMPVPNCCADCRFRIADLSCDSKIGAKLIASCTAGERRIQIKDDWLHKEGRAFFCPLEILLVHN